MEQLYRIMAAAITRAWLFAFLFIILAMPALAAEVVAPGIYDELVRPYLVELIGLLVAGVIAWAVQRFHALTGIQIEARRREALQSALTNAAVVALERGTHFGVEYVKRSVPDAVRYFNLTDKGIERQLEPHLKKIDVVQAAKAFRRL
jgi:hypothetical protein